MKCSDCYLLGDNGCAVRGHTSPDDDVCDIMRPRLEASAQARDVGAIRKTEVSQWEANQPGRAK